jgi:hypothetical protein
MSEAQEPYVPRKALARCESEYRYVKKSDSFVKRAKYDIVNATLCKGDRTIVLPDIEWWVNGYTPNVDLMADARFRYREWNGELIVGWIDYPKFGSESVETFRKQIRSGVWSHTFNYKLEDIAEDDEQTIHGEVTLTVHFTQRGVKRILRGLEKYLQEVAYVSPLSVAVAESHEQ